MKKRFLAVMLSTVMVCSTVMPVAAAENVDAVVLAEETEAVTEEITEAATEAAEQAEETEEITEAVTESIVDETETLEETEAAETEIEEETEAAGIVEAAVKSSRTASIASATAVGLNQVVSYTTTGASFYYEFTAPETGRYYFQANGVNDGEHRLYWNVEEYYDYDDDEYYDGYDWSTSWYGASVMQDREYFYCQKGSTYVFKINTGGSEQALNAQFSIYQKVVKDWNISKPPIKVDYSQLDQLIDLDLTGLELLVQYTNGKTEYVEYDDKNWDALNVSVSYEGEYSYLSHFAPRFAIGQQPMDVTLDDSDKICTFNVNIKPVNEVVNQVLTEGSNPVVYESKKTGVYTFVPTATGVYTVSSDARTTDPYLSIYDANGIQLASDDDSGDYSNFKIAYNFVKGYTYVFEVRSDIARFNINIVQGGEMEKQQWGRLRVIQAPTCGATGVGYRIGGGVIKTEEIPAGGAHSYGAFKVTKAATALTAGVQEHTCTVCGHKETQAIAKIKATIKLNVSSIKLQKGKSTTAVKVTTAAGDSVKSWKSSNTKIATVSSKGKITGKKVGKATITVTLQSGLQKSFSLICY